MFKILNFDEKSTVQVFSAPIFAIFLAILSIFSFYQIANADTDQWENITPAGASGRTFNAVAATGNYVYIGTDQGVYKSSDSGATWSEVNTGLGATLNITSIAIGWIYDGVNSVYAVDASTPVFVGTAGGGVFSSTLGDTSWTAVNTDLTDLNISDLKIDQFLATQGVLTDIYAATPSGVFFSDSLGAAWQEGNTGLSGAPVKLSTTFADGTVYALTGSGKVYASELYSLSYNPPSWSERFDANGTTTNGLSTLHGVGNILWLSTDKGIYKSDDLGMNWASTSIGLPSQAIKNVSSDFYNPNIAYASAYGAGVYRTTNEAIENPNPQIPQWLPINIGLSDMNIKGVETDPTTQLSVYAFGSAGVYKLVYSGDPVEDVDLTPPSAVTNLSAVYVDSETARLSWTAPGGNANYGTSTAYVIRYSPSPIDEGNFSSATAVSPQPTPHGSGYAETYNAY